MDIAEMTGAKGVLVAVGGKCVAVVVGEGEGVGVIVAVGVLVGVGTKATKPGNSLLSDHKAE